MTFIPNNLPVGRPDLTVMPGDLAVAYSARTLNMFGDQPRQRHYLALYTPSVPTTLLWPCLDTAPLPPVSFNVTHPNILLLPVPADVGDTAVCGRDDHLPFVAALFLATLPSSHQVRLLPFRR